MVKNDSFKPKFTEGFACGYHCHTVYDKRCKIHTCFVCFSKVLSRSSLVCATCTKGCHVACMGPTLTDLFEKPWICTICEPNPEKNDEVNFYTGKVPGILCGLSWQKRTQVREDYVHLPPIAGIGNSKGPAYSIVSSGSYDADVDLGDIIYYTGSGGNEGIAYNTQNKNQELLGYNLSLACSIDNDFQYDKKDPEYYMKLTKEDCSKIGSRFNKVDAIDWRKSSPVRVVRAIYNPSKTSQKIGYRYDGIFKLESFWFQRHSNSFIVMRFQLRRDDTEPSPLTAEGKQYILDNKLFLKMAEARHMHSRKARGLEDFKSTDSKPTKALTAKRAAKRGQVLGKVVENSSESEVDSEENDVITAYNEAHVAGTSYSPLQKFMTEMDQLIPKDVKNQSLWRRLLQQRYPTVQDFVRAVSNAFRCRHCQNLVQYMRPVTTPCSHNFCFYCFRSASTLLTRAECPYCKTDFNTSPFDAELYSFNKKPIRVPHYDLSPNQPLSKILLKILHFSKMYLEP